MNSQIYQLSVDTEFIFDIHGPIFTTDTKLWNYRNESIALFESDVVQSSLNLDKTIQVSFFISYFP